MVSERDQEMLRIAAEQSEYDRASVYKWMTNLIYRNEESEMEKIKTLLPYIDEYSSPNTAEVLLCNVQQDNVELASQKELMHVGLRELSESLATERNLLSETKTSVKDFEMMIDGRDGHTEEGVATSAEGEERMKKLFEERQETSELLRSLTHGSVKSFIHYAKELCRGYADKVEEMKQIVEARHQQCIEEISKMNRKLLESRYNNAKEVAYLCLYGDYKLNDHLAIRWNRKIHDVDTIISTGHLVNKVQQDTWDDVLRLQNRVKEDYTFLLIASTIIFTRVKKVSQGIA